MRLRDCSKEKDDERVDADTLFVAKRSDDTAIDEGALRELFQKYGDVKVRPCC